jgi:putative ABC transport system permease protein
MKLFGRRRIERDMADELEFHIQSRVNDLIWTKGLSHEEALRRARIEFGAIEKYKEEGREAHGFRVLDELRQDIEYAVRILRKNLGFTIVAVGTLALAIGANSAVFSVVNAVLLKPLAYKDAERIVTLTTGAPATAPQHELVSFANFTDWHDQSSSFESLAYYYTWEAPVMLGSSASYARVTKVSPEFFRVFAVEPVVGRFFTTEEMTEGSGGGLMISYAYWQGQYGGDSGVLGRTIRVYNRTMAIVGVLPSGFDFPYKSDLWFPGSVFPGTKDRLSRNYLAVGRLRRDVSLKKAQTEMTSIAARLEQQYPETNKDQGVTLKRMQDAMVGDVRLTLYILWGAVSVVLLIACANTATLLLSRATARAREVAVRTAVGASRRRIVKQLITESLLLASLAGALGLLVAYEASKIVVALAPADLPRLGENSIDVWVLAFTIAISLITSLLFGVVPALHASRVDLNDPLKQAGTRSGTDERIHGIRGFFVIAEIALSVILLVMAGLLVKSFAGLQNVPLGFQPENVLVMRGTGPGSIRDTNLFFSDILSQIRNLPGVVSAGATMAPPGRVESSGHYYIDHMPARPDPGAPGAVNSVVTPGTFAALGIPFKSGRDFTDGDRRDKPFVAVINEALVRKSFVSENPIGRTIFCGFDSTMGMTIVGVVGDVRQGGPASEPMPECYMSYRQHAYNNTTLNVVARTIGDSTLLVDTLRRLARERSPDIPLTFTTMEARLSENVAAPRFRTLLFGLFAVLAVCLATAGVYGVMSYAVGQRSYEIGLRLALGASTGSVLRLVLARGLALTGIGLATGLVAALAGTRVVASMLFHVQANDPQIYVGVAILLGIVGLVASYIPARRASTIDPAITLRQE